MRCRSWLSVSWVAAGFLVRSAVDLVSAGSVVVVRAHRDGDRWKIAELDMLGQPLANGEPAETR